MVFDYINGFHDAANAIATVVATKVLTPFQAVLWAAFFNFLAYWVFGFGVADTVAKTAHTSSINLIVILAGVIAAIIWNLFTWWKGIPSSSSHTLIGGFAGAAIAHGFSGVVQDPEHYGLKIVSWFKAAKEGELLPSGVLIVILFIVFAPLLVIFGVTPIIIMLTLVVVALTMTPMMVALVAKRRFPQLEARRGASFFHSLLWSLGSTAAALLALVVSVPLYLVVKPSAIIVEIVSRDTRTRHTV